MSRRSVKRTVADKRTAALLMLTQTRDLDRVDASSIVRSYGLSPAEAAQLIVSAKRARAAP